MTGRERDPVRDLRDYADAVDRDRGFETGLTITMREAAARLEAAEAALRFYAERREYQHAGPGKQHDLRNCPIALRDSFDGAGPGARARAALRAEGATDA